MSITAMKQALEALECLFGIPEQFTGKGGGDVAVWTLGGSYRAQQAIPVLRQAIEQAEKSAHESELMMNDHNYRQKFLEKQEPVACVIDGDLYFHHEIDWEDLAYQGHGVELLYTAPQPQEFVCSTGLCHYKTAAQREWVGLTDEEMDVLVDRFARYELARAIEAKLKEKNT